MTSLAFGSLAYAEAEAAHIKILQASLTPEASDAWKVDLCLLLDI